MRMVFNQMKKVLKISLLLMLLSLLTINIVPSFCQECKGNSNVTQFDIIIVLGNPANDNCKPAPMMRERVNTGVELFKKGWADKILFTGSSVANQCIEADVMAEYAISLGVPDSCIIKESRAENTYQNAKYAVERLKEFNFKKAVIVTSKFHIKRSCNIFSNYDIEYSMYSSETPKDLSNLKLLIWKLRENTILTYHAIFGYSKTFGLKNK
jgi:uncharacterized SAM-binding protein YcdF (DUF218 family)